MFYVIFHFPAKFHKNKKYTSNVFSHVSSKDLKNKLRRNLKRQIAPCVSLWQRTLRQLFKSALCLLFSLFTAYSFFLNEWNRFYENGSTEMTYWQFCFVMTQAARFQWIKPGPKLPIISPFLSFIFPFYIEVFLSGFLNFHYNQLWLFSILYVSRWFMAKTSAVKIFGVATATSVFSQTENIGSVLVGKTVHG